MYVYVCICVCVWTHLGVRKRRILAFRVKKVPVEVERNEGEESDQIHRCSNNTECLRTVGVSVRVRREIEHLGLANFAEILAKESSIMKHLLYCWNQPNRCEVGCQREQPACEKLIGTEALIGEQTQQDTDIRGHRPTTERSRSLRRRC